MGLMLSWKTLQTGHHHCSQRLGLQDPLMMMTIAVLEIGGSVSA